jgi:hypothetical protein
VYVYATVAALPVGSNPVTATLAGTTRFASLTVVGAASVNGVVRAIFTCASWVLILAPIAQYVGQSAPMVSYGAVTAGAGDTSLGATASPPAAG